MHVRRPRMSLDHCRQSFGTFSAVDCVLLQRVVRRARLHYSSCHYWVRKRASISKPSSPIRISSTPSKSQALDLFKDFEFPFSVFRLQSHTGSTKFLHLDDFSFPDFVKHMNHHSSMLCCWILLRFLREESSGSRKGGLIQWFSVFTCIYLREIPRVAMMSNSAIQHRRILVHVSHKIRKTKIIKM